MPVSPQQLRGLRFDERSHGYDKHQVDQVMARLADVVEDLQRSLSAAEARASAGAGGPGGLDDSLRRTLILAQRTADAAVREAREEAERIRSQARVEADGLLAEAHRRAAALPVGVETERARLIDDARRDCEDRIARVRDELAGTEGRLREELAQQVQQLTARRDQLVELVARFDGHLTSRRQRLAGVVDQLAALLDDPEAWSPPEVPTVDDTPGDPVADLAPLEVRVEAMDDFADDRPVAAPSSFPSPHLAVGLEDDDDDAAGPPTQLHPIVPGASDDDDDRDEDDELDEADEVELRDPSVRTDPTDGGDPVDRDDRRIRPAWADAVPSEADPTVALSVRSQGVADAGQQAEVMERFFAPAGDERRGWFRRRS